MKRALLLACIIIAAVFSAAPAAQAASRDGVCDAGEFCLYYNSNYQGSVSDFTGSIPDYGDEQPSCYEFKGAGNGQGRCVKNDAASVWNRTSDSVTVFFNSDYAGASQAIATGVKANLNEDLKNENASHRFNTASTGKVNMSYALYRAAGSITCGFDGYEQTPGRHEGIDFKRAFQAPVYALVEGQVTYIGQGAVGSGTISTISIYHAASNKTVIYLHTAPLSSLSVGQTIKRNKQIAVESWRGAGSAQSSSHTHVEVRNGRQTHAHKSVNDPNLENDNPTAFWNARGYHVR